MRKFTDLDEREILALAISLEEEHGRIYADYAAPEMMKMRTGKSLYKKFLQQSVGRFP
ncbi:MAG: hypothetical protein WC026_13450 [Hyphomicrobium sp.]